MPWEFMRLTPAEYRELVRGKRLERARQEELAAWMLANLMNVSGKTLAMPTSPERLLGRVLVSKAAGQKRDG